MSFTGKLMQTYFNYAYNPVYDFTTARLNRYRQLQEQCIGKLELKDNDRVLSVGTGTGNELSRILARNGNVDMVVVDFSHTALDKAHKKASALGKKIEGHVMDAQYLIFSGESFDKVICIHVMDFLKDDMQATREILRVLKAGGQFVITYPSRKEGAKLGFNLMKDSFRHGINAEGHPVKLFLRWLIQMAAGFVYLPLLLRPNKKSYRLDELATIISDLKVDSFQIDEDNIYQDYIVYGRK